MRWLIQIPCVDDFWAVGMKERGVSKLIYRQTNTLTSRLTEGDGREELLRCKWHLIDQRWCVS